MVRLLIIILGTLLCAQFSIAAPNAISYQGQIIKPNGQPLEGTNVTFTLEVLSPAGSDCILYKEQHIINMSGSNGVFSLVLGQGTQGGGNFEDSNPLEQAMSNGTGTVSPTTCGTGTDYTPGNTDGRQLRVTFDDGSGAETLANQQIVSVPYAQNAQDAAMLDGFVANDFVRVNAPGLTQANLESVFDNGTNQTELMALLGGTSTQYSPLSSNGASNLPTFTTATPPSSPQAGDMWLNSDTGAIMYYDGSTTQTVGSGTIDASQITSGTIANARLDLGTGANQIVQLNGSSQLPAVDGSLLTGVTGTDSSKLSLAGGNMTGAIVMDAENEVRFADNDNSHYVGFKAPASITATGSFVWELPADDGSNGDILTTNGAGVLSFATLNSANWDTAFGWGDHSGAGYLTSESDPGLQTLTTAEVDQLENINSETISNTQWSYLGNMGGQPLESVTGTTLDNVWSANGLLRRTGANTYDVITDSSSNWNTAFGWGDHSLAGYLTSYTETQSLDDAYNNGSTVTVDTSDVTFNLTGTNDFQVQDNGTTSFIVDDLGNVGVGTSSPSAKLNVEGSSATQNVLRVVQNNDPSGAGVVHLSADHTSMTGPVLFARQRGVGDILQLFDDTQNVFVVKDGGNVGIGTTTPNAPLVIETDSAAANTRVLALRNTNGANNRWQFNLGNDNQDLDVVSDNSGLTVATFTDNGRFGVGTTSPNYSLEVSSANAAFAGYVQNTSASGYGLGVKTAGTDSTRYAFDVENGTASVLRVRNDGRVGIGTISPGSLLDVAGGIKIANDTDTCDASKAGALKYVGGNVEFCNGSAWQALGTASGGEVNTASNIGTAGVGVFDSKSVSDLRFRNINAGSNKVTVTDDTANDEIDINVNEANFDPTVIPNTAAGGIAATNVQAAINELDTEKVAATRDLAAGSGLTGGGDLSANRTFNVGAGAGITVNADDVAVNINGTTAETSIAGTDELLIHDASAAGLRKMTRDNFVLSESEVDAFVGNNGYLTSYTETQSLDDAYNNGSSVTVDTSDMIFNLTSTNDFQIQDNGATSFIVNDSGSVGVGTANPSYKLQVAGGTASALFTTTDYNGTSTGTGIRLAPGAATGDTYGVLQTYTSGGTVIGGDLTLQPDGGRVGIGTTNPTAKIEISSVGANTAALKMKGNLIDSGRIFDIDFDRFDANDRYWTVYGSGVNGENIRWTSEVGTHGGSVDSSFLFGNILEYSQQGNSRFYINASGNVGVGTSSPESSALLDVSSTTKGFAPPRMTTAQRNAIVSPVAGLQIYNTSTSNVDYYDGSSWQSLTGEVKYMKLGMSAHQTVDVNDIVSFDTLRSSSGMTRTGNGIDLKAGVTYRIEASLNWVSASGSMYLGYQLYNGTTGIGLSAYTNGAGSSVLHGMKSNILEFYTPSVDETMYVRIIDDNIGTGQVSSAWNAYFVATEMVGASTGGGADNLGSHIATQNIQLGSQYISNDGGASEGLSFDTSGNATFTGTVTASSFTGSGANLTNIPTAAIDNNAITVDKVDFASSDGINIPQVASAPGSPTTGQVYYNTTDNRLYLYNGSTWEEVGSGGSTAAIITGWPDILVCTQGGTKGIFYIYHQNATQTYYKYSDGNFTGPTYLYYNNTTKAFIGSGGAGTSHDSTDCEVSMNTNISAGRAKFFGNDIATVTGDADDDTKIMVEKNTDEDHIRFDTAGSERMTIDNSGNVGIGITSPEGKLNIKTGVDGTAQTSYSLVLDSFQHQSSFPSYDSATSNAYINSYYELAGTPNDFTRYLDLAAYGSPDGSNGDSAIRFLTNPVTSASTPLERMRIDGDGNVGIGTASPGTSLDVINSLSTQYAPVATLSRHIGDPNFHLRTTKGETTNSNGDITSKLQLNYVGGGENAAINFHRGSSSTGGFLSFSTNNGSERVRIDGNGNVGVGTTAPNTLMHLEQAGDINIRLRDTASNANGEIWDIGIGAGGSGNSELTFRQRNDDGTQKAEVMRMDSSGNIGIGTTSPSHRLHVEGNAGVALRLKDNAVANADWAIYPQTGNTTKLFRIVDYNGGTTADRLTIDASGNVGINTVAPAAPLHVVDASENNRALVLEGRNDLAGFQIRAPSDRLNLSTGVNKGDAPTLSISTNSVGIGTINPADTLDVNGGIAVRGLATITDRMQWTDSIQYTSGAWNTLTNVSPAFGSYFCQITFGSAGIGGGAIYTYMGTFPLSIIGNTNGTAAHTLPLASAAHALNGRTVEMRYKANGGHVPGSVQIRITGETVTSPVSFTTKCTKFF